MTTRSGKVTVIAEPRTDLLVESGGDSLGEVATDESGVVSLKARNGSKTLLLRCPEDTAVTVGAASGNVELRGRFSRASVTTASASIQVERAGRLDLRSASGDIDVGECVEACRIQTMSGKARVGKARKAAVSTVSGRVDVDEAAGDIQVNTASGRVELGCRGTGDVSVKTMSGAVTVRLPEGIRPQTRLRSLSGKSRVDCPEGDDCRVAVSSFSGKIEVVAG
ncbi:MAG: DUF4097 family beta strand repeat protein [Chloroflexi bacterium]|nr:DUF4097 family beta strand repeat protein [Chloroflexota bacterium]